MYITPEKIYKSVSECQHAKDLCRGKIILRSINFYRSHPCPSFKDFKEFSSEDPERRGGLSNDNVIIFCAHKHKPEKKDHVVKIYHPCDLFNYISEVLGIKNSYFGEIFYKCPKTPGFPKINFYCENIYLNDCEQPISNPDIEYCYYKYPEFKEEDEVRMCFFVSHHLLQVLQGDNSGIQVKFLRRFLRLDRLSTSVPSNCEEEMGFEDWRASKRNNHYLLIPEDDRSKIPDDPYNYWFEIHIKLPEFIVNNFRYLK